MAKKCLHCGNPADNGVSACADCLGKINEVRRSLSLRVNIPKGVMRSFERYVFLIIISILAANILTLGLAVSLIFRKLSAFIPAMRIFIYPALTGFVICCGAGMTAVRLLCRVTLEQLLDRQTYSQQMAAGIFNSPIMKRLLGAVLYYMLLFGGSFLCVVAAVVFLEQGTVMHRTAELMALREIFVTQSASLGLLMGFIISFYRYFDWRHRV